MERMHEMPFGAQPTHESVRFRLWAPAARAVELWLGDDGSERREAMGAQNDGWWELVTVAADAGSRYRFRIDGELSVPDPASRFQPQDVHGASEVVDPRAYAWSDNDWLGRPWEEAVLYELHVGTFTPEGTFAGVESRLDYLAALGVTAIELMPVADFPGAHNWGYDGVYPFAPDASYGRPEDFKRLVDAAHARGLMVFLDVVYNHFGPDGNYLPRYAPRFFSERHRTPWGAAINFDAKDSRAVRAFFIHNALYWLEEFHLDGLRLDAVHAIVDDSHPDILEELAASLRAGPGRERHVHLVLENDGNEAHYLAREGARPRFFVAQWNDDVHHAMHVLATGERAGYYADYAADPLRHLGRCLAEGFAYQGEQSPYRNGAPRGDASAHLPPTAFVAFLQNHDQVGNRAFGERLGALAREAPLRALTSILLLGPQVPLLFMGEEWNAPEPFPFFCDFGADLARAVRDGRRREFARLPEFAEAAARERIPDPGAAETFARAVLDWSMAEHDVHRQWRALVQELLAVRRREIVPRLAEIRGGGARFRLSGDQGLVVRWPLGEGGALVLLANLGPRGERLASAPAGRLLHVTGGLRAGQIAPWSVAWYLEGA